MASTFTTSKVAAGVQPRVIESGVISVTGSYALAAALVVNDVIQMVKVPAGATIVNTILSVPDLDSNGSPAIVLAVGDGSDDDRFVTGSTVGQAGGTVMSNTPTGTGYAYAAEDTVDVKVTTAPATGATSGTITLTVLYTMDA